MRDPGGTPGILCERYSEFLNSICEWMILSMKFHFTVVKRMFQNICYRKGALGLIKNL